MRVYGGTDVSGTMDITSRNLGTSQYLYPRSDGTMYSASNERLVLSYVNNVATQNTIDRNIASILYSWNGVYINYTGNGFQSINLPTEYLGFQAQDKDVFYCAVINETENPDDPDDPNPEEPEEPEEPYTSYYIAFNPGNGNGVDGDFDAPGSMYDYGGREGIERTTIDVGQYVDSNGEVTITFPSDNELGTEITIIGNDENKYTIAKEKSYDYKLKGWYNIATGEYIDVSNGPVTKVVKVVENGNQINNVYYADWVAANYNLGRDKESTQYNAVDTNDFITIKMFDYNELFNILSTRIQQTGVTQENWTDTGSFSNTGLKSFLFQKLHTASAIAYPTEIKEWNVYGSDAAHDGTWEMNTTNNAILIKLFDETGSTLGVNYIGEGNYLYHKITDGNGNEYYEYDSTKNAATYNQEDKRFYVWDNTLQVNTGQETEPVFLPLNGEQANGSDPYIEGAYNYWFGMTTEIDFYLPDNVGTTQNRTNQVERSDSSGSTDMVFRFTGDDDVWIFIDDKLVVDLGGIHRAMNAEINFSTGQITVTNFDNQDLTSTRAELANFTGLQEGEHTLKFYYLERGGGGSNYSLTFNMIHEPVEEPEDPDDPDPDDPDPEDPDPDPDDPDPEDPEDTEKIAVTVKKEWDNIEGITIPEKVSVTLYNGETAVETIELNAANEWTYVWPNLNASGNYTVKEEELEEYRVQYDTVYGVAAVAENNAWMETHVLEPNEYIITNSDLNYDNTPKNEGFVAMDSEFNAKELHVSDGVINSSEITNDIIWIAIEKEDGYVFQNKETKKYIQFGIDYQLYTVDSIDEADIFYNETETMGIRVHVQRYGNQISLIYDNNMFQMRVNGNTDVHDYICVRLFTSGQPIETNSRSYQITNTYKPPVVIKKVDSESKTPIEGVKFTITNQEGKYYTPDGWVDEETTISTDSTGIAKILRLDDGTYTLTETETTPGYNKVNNPITFTITNGKITLLNGNLVYLDEEDEKQLTMCIENVKGYILPDTGGHGVIVYQIVGIAMMSIAVIVFKRNLNAKKQ